MRRRLLGASTLLFGLGGGLVVTGCVGRDADTPGHIYTIVDTGQGMFDPNDDLKGMLPGDLAVDPGAGTLYISDWNSHQLYVRDATGTVRSIAGTGVFGHPIDGPARDTPLGIVAGLLLDGEHGIYLTDVFSGYAEHLDLATGELVRIAGAGTRQRYAGDGGAALDAQLSMPSALVRLADGRLLLADQENQVLRTIEPSTGLIDHFAGRCVVDWSGACDAPLACPGSEKLVCAPATCGAPCSPAAGPALATSDDVRFGFTGSAAAPPSTDLVVAADGTIFVSDSGNQRVRAIHTDGRVDTVIDGLRSPGALALASDGTLYIADLWDSCVYSLTPDATLATVAGTCGTNAFAGDGGLATQALLEHPLGLALDEAARRLYISDAGNHRVRYISL